MVTAAKTPHSWAKLIHQARLGNIKINNVAVAGLGRRVNELENQLAELGDEAQALLDALPEGEELDEEDQARFDAIMDEESGEYTKLKAKLAKAKKQREHIKQLAFDRNQQSGNPFDPDGNLNNNSGPRIVNRLGRLANFNGEDAERNAYTSGMFLRARVAAKRGDRDEVAENYLENRGLRVPRNAQTEGLDSAGGFLVPDPLSSAIIDVRDSGGVARQIGRIVAMTSDTLGIPKRTGGLTVDYIDEATAFTESSKDWGRVPLAAKKRGTLTKISQELREDALINVVDDIVTEIGTALRINQDREAINGDGTATSGSVTGLVPALGAAGKEVASGDWDATVMADFTKVMGILPAKFWDYQLSWICSPAYYHSVILRSLVEGGGNAVAALQQGDGGRKEFLGYPVYLTNQLPSTYTASQTDVLFGAFSQALLIGDRTGIQIGQSDQFAFDEDVLTIKARTRYDMRVHEAGDGSDAGAYVGLVAG